MANEISAAERARVDGCVLSRTDLRELGFAPSAVDAIFRACPVIVFEGQRRPFIRSEDFRALLAARTFDGSRVRAA